MTCSTCGTPLPQGAAHCPHCGSPTPDYYSQASIAPNDPTMLSSSSAGAEPPPPPPPPLSGSSSYGLASPSPYGSLAYPTPYESSGGVPPPPPKRPARRVDPLVGVVLLVLLLSGGGVFAWLASASARNAASAGTQSTTTAQSHASATAGVDVTGLPASSPSASTPSRLTYRGHTSNVLAVAWSPDGTRIASGSFDTVRCGMPPPAPRSSPTRAIPVKCMPRPGRPMARALLRRVWTKRCRCGMPPPARRSSPTGAIPMKCVRWPGHPMAS